MALQSEAVIVSSLGCCYQLLYGVSLWVVREILRSRVGEKESGVCLTDFLELGFNFSVPETRTKSVN